MEAANFSPLHRSSPLTRTILLAVLCVAFACASRADDPLSEAILDSPPAGFKLVKGPASGEMDRDAAVNATIADPSEKSALLGRIGYQQGRSRVWSKGNDYITILVYDFSGADGAKRLVDFEIRQLDRTPGFAPFTMRQIPGSRAYVLSASSRKGGALFCQGAWFTVDTRAFSVATCGALPNNTELATRMAVAQYKRAR